MERHRIDEHISAADDASGRRKARCDEGGVVFAERVEHRIRFLSEISPKRAIDAFGIYFRIAAF